MQPTIGRVVILQTNNARFFNGAVYDTSQPLAAIVTAVHKTGMIAVTAFPPGREAIPVFEATSAEEKIEGYPYWEWPEIKKADESASGKGGNKKVAKEKENTED